MSIDTAALDRTFPVLWGYSVKEHVKELQQAKVTFMPLCIPWSMLAPHEKQAQMNHSQTLARLAERGGLSPCEALAILDDRAWRRMPITKSCAELSDRILAYHRQRALTETYDAGN